MNSNSLEARNFLCFFVLSIQIFILYSWENIFSTAIFICLLFPLNLLNHLPYGKNEKVSLVIVKKYHLCQSFSRSHTRLNLSRAFFITNIFDSPRGARRKFHYGATYEIGRCYSFFTSISIPMKGKTLKFTKMLIHYHMTELILLEKGKKKWQEQLEFNLNVLQVRDN